MPRGVVEVRVAAGYVFVDSGQPHSVYLSGSHIDMRKHAGVLDTLPTFVGNRSARASTYIPEGDWE
jgi:hypothetical protein